MVSWIHLTTNKTMPVLARTQVDIFNFISGGSIKTMVDQSTVNAYMHHCIIDPQAPIIIYRSCTT